MSMPPLSQFDPRNIPYQYECIEDLFFKFDYDLGVHELLLSGSVGSAKSAIMAHIAVMHCLRNPDAVFLLGRKSMPALKDTLLTMILQHLASEVGYQHYIARGIIKFGNGAKMICVSWSDKNYKKVRSYALSAAAIEEMTENSDLEYYKEILMRVGRIPSVKECFIIGATNPDSPAHPLYKYFMVDGLKNPTRHVRYSLTEQNPYLPPTYIEKLKDTLSPREADRMLRGEWVELDTERIYYNYTTERNFKDTAPTIDKGVPIDLSFDFNIAENKPMSSTICQARGRRRNVLKSYHINGFNTQQMIDEMLESGLFETHRNRVRVFGDASGKYADTRSKFNDYEIIERSLKGYRRKDGSYLDIEMCIPRKNPPIRRRNNLVNGLCYSDSGKTELFVYDEWVDEGLRLTQYKKGSTIEDDNLPQQHATTTVGYWCDYLEYRMDVTGSRTVQL